MSGLYALEECGSNPKHGFKLLINLTDHSVVCLLGIRRI